jgi:hypothetical protein
MKISIVSGIYIYWIHSLNILHADENSIYYTYLVNSLTIEDQLSRISFIQSRISIIYWYIDFKISIVSGIYYWIHSLNILFVDGNAIYYTYLVNSLTIEDQLSLILYIHSVKNFNNILNIDIKISIVSGIYWIHSLNILYTGGNAIYYTYLVNILAIIEDQLSRISFIHSVKNYNIIIVNIDMNILIVSGIYWIHSLNILYTDDNAIYYTYLVNSLTIEDQLSRISFIHSFSQEFQ